MKTWMIFIISLTCLMFVVIILRNWSVNYFRSVCKDGDLCSFYLGEMRFKGKIFEKLENTVIVEVFTANFKVEFKELPLNEIYPATYFYF